ncbi:MAG: hypothetical protein DMG67_14025 [Acidobacteria bacterium]|nr:MAG: hypothetical protein DMG67_14025 [Acidobacteriota bacterium]
MAGRAGKEVGPQKKKYIEHPDLKPPDGEPFERFERRWGGALRQFMKHNEANPEDQIALAPFLHEVFHLDLRSPQFRNPRRHSLGTSRSSGPNLFDQWRFQADDLRQPLRGRSFGKDR